MDSIFFRTVAFILASVLLIIFSRKSLFSIRTHGFYRFFAFEGILFLLLYNYPVWFENPFSLQHLFSWLLLGLSIAFVVIGFSQLKVQGGSKSRDDFPANHDFENTVHLVNDGIYRYVRHPMYSSLLLLAWGACFKRLDLFTVLCGCFVTLCLYLTALVEEKENALFFGDSYADYISKTKRFIPYLF